MSEINTMRLDKWLWAARFFKTRALAQKQIELGRIKVNNERVKNSKYIVVGDVVDMALNSLPYRLTWRQDEVPVGHIRVCQGRTSYDLDVNSKTGPTMI